jgi:hypothetical protein
MNKKEFQRIPVIGIILVLLGALLLMKQLNMVKLNTAIVISMGFTLYGAVAVIRSYSTNIRRSLFWGGLCFFGGILFMLSGFDLISRSPEVLIPAFIIIFGLAFVTLYLFNFRDIHLLIPAILFIGIGTALMMTELGFWYVSDVWTNVHHYWPIALILFGISMLLRKKNP